MYDVCLIQFDMICDQLLFVWVKHHYIAMIYGCAAQTSGGAFSELVIVNCDYLRL